MDLYPPAPYLVDPWTTTWLSHHYPLRHHPFEHTRHALGHAFRGLSDFGGAGNGLICPAIDVRESETVFYIDVDLPGMKDKKEMTLKWISARTMLLRAVVKRAPTPEDVGKGEEKGEDKDKEQEEEYHHRHHHHDEPEKGPFTTVHERKVGLFGRMFNFPVDVDHDVTTAKLEAGVLSISVKKVKAEMPVDRKVEVEVGGDDKIVLQ